MVKLPRLEMRSLKNLSLIDIMVEVSDSLNLDNYVDAEK